ncbi:MAG: hypothetical protein RL150_588 [Candidatus Parcubacteria bacterium]|jgi:hypothetical protein
MPDGNIVRHARSSQRHLREFQGRFKETFATDIDRDASIQLLENRPKLPPFPTLIVLINAIFDTLSIAASLLSLTGVGVVVYWIFKILTWVINFFWFFGKESGTISRITQKIILRKIMLMLVLFAISDAIPFNDVITANTFLILSVHYHHTKVVKAFWFILDEVQRFVPKKVARLNQNIDAYVSSRTAA